MFKATYWSTKKLFDYKNNSRKLQTPDENHVKRLLDSNFFQPLTHIIYNGIIKRESVSNEEIIQQLKNVQITTKKSSLLVNFCNGKLERGFVGFLSHMMICKVALF